MRHAARAGLVLALAATISGCGVLPAVEPNLDGTGWRAILAAGNQPLRGSEPTVRFEGGRISGSAGCNRYGGRAVIEDGRLTVTDLVVTLADCAEPAASTQQVVMEAIGSGSLRFEGGNLVIGGPSGEVVFRRDDTVR